MKVDNLLEWATAKDRFLTLTDFILFGKTFLEYRSNIGFQAELVARNNNAYRFFQYKADADFQITRPINTNLFYEIDEFDAAAEHFFSVLEEVMNDTDASPQQCEALSRVIYTCQQAIGATLDALPSTRSNTVRKINSTLFERFILLTIEYCGIECKTGTLTVPIEDESGNTLFGMKYQYDLMVEVAGELKAIGSVKTSSKDQLDKVFIDKFLYNRLANTPTPHFAIFLHDVQRTGREPNYRANNTFRSSHFKGYTIKLNPLDGVYYCDLLPQMSADPFLAGNISRIDQFYIKDLPAFVRSSPMTDTSVNEVK